MYDREVDISFKSLEKALEKKPLRIYIMLIFGILFAVYSFVRLIYVDIAPSLYSIYLNKLDTYFIIIYIIFMVSLYFCRHKANNYFNQINMINVAVFKRMILQQLGNDQAEYKKFEQLLKNELNKFIKLELYLIELKSKFLYGPLFAFIVGIIASQFASINGEGTQIKIMCLIVYVYVLFSLYNAELNPNKYKILSVCIELL